MSQRKKPVLEKACLINPLVTKRYIYAAYKKKNLDDLFLKVRQWDF